MSPSALAHLAAVMAALAGLAAVGRAEKADDSPAGGDRIAPNTWVNARPKYILPKDIADVRWVTTDGYCGSTYRSKTGTVLFRSGVASKSVGLSPGFYSNATLEWNLKTNVVRVVEIANWAGGSYGGGGLLPAYKEHPTPTPRHTYDGITYVPGQDAMYLMLGANWRIGSKATDEAKTELARDAKCTWRYRFADRRWERIEHSVRHLWPNVYRISPYESHLQHWPEGGKLLFLNDRGTRYAEFDLKTGTWRPVELAGKPPMSLYNARSTWDSRRQLWVFRLGSRACTFDPGSRTYRALPDSGDDAKDRSKGIVYIPRHDVYLICGPTGNDTKVFDIENRAWRTIPGGAIELVNGYPQYDPKTDQVALVYQLKAFKFRYVPSELRSPASSRAAPAR